MTKEKEKKFSFNTSSQSKGIVSLLPEKKIPDVIFSPEADAVVSAIQYSGRTQEVGWMMSASLTEEGDIYLDKVFVCKQEVTSVATELDKNAFSEILTEWGQWCLENNKDSDTLCAWFHLHPKSMSTSPSSQDEETMIDWFEMYPTMPFWVRGIVNGKGERKIDVYYPNEQYACTSVDWYTDSSEHDDAIDTAMTQIKERATVVTSPVIVNRLPQYSAQYAPVLTPTPSRPTQGVNVFNACGMVNDRIKVKNTKNNKVYHCEPNDALTEIQAYTENGNKVNFNKEMQHDIEQVCWEYISTFTSDDWQGLYSY